MSKCCATIYRKRQQKVIGDSDGTKEVILFQTHQKTLSLVIRSRSMLDELHIGQIFSVRLKSTLD